MTTPKIGLAVIARDAADTLPGLLASVEGCFDQVVLVDTGSQDETKRVFRAWCGSETERAAQADRVFMHTLKDLEWADDFAAARAYADSLFHPSVEWLSWADCDDEIHGADRLRALAANAPADLSAYVADYDYLQHPDTGACLCRLRRERLVRRGRGVWVGRVHEAQTITGGAVANLPAADVEWRHRKPADRSGTSNDRNLRILRAWNQEEPHNTRVLMYLGTEELGAGRYEPAEAWLRRYLERKTDWDQERAQVHRKLALCLLRRGETREAEQGALEALALCPSWPDSYLTLAEACYQRGETEKAAHWAQQVLDAGPPDTMLIVNPLDYTVQPRVLLAGCLAAHGQIAEACEQAERVLTAQPGHPVLAPAYVQWRAQLKRDKTANTFVTAAELLVAHDEQAKALVLLEQTVPYYAQDHPRVVQARSVLRERVAPLYDADGYQAFYRDEGSKPEDMVDDAIAVGDQLPRARFLLDQVRELAEAA